MSLPIAVEISPPDAPRENVAALLAACSHVAADVECLLAGDAPEGGTQAVAIVTWQTDDRVLVEVGLRREGRSEWRSRAVKFEAGDQPLERWRTAGFVIGTLAERDGAGSEGAPPRPTPSEPAPEPAPKPVEPAPAPPAAGLTPEPEPERAPPRAPPLRIGEFARGALDVGAGIGPGLDATRAGAMARLHATVIARLRAAGTVRYFERAEDSDGLRARWITAALGADYAFGSEELELSLGLDVRLEQFRASVETEQGDAAQSRWLGGLGSTLALAWMPTRPVGVFVGADAAWMLGTTDIEIEGAASARDGALRYLAEGGLRFRLW